MIKDRKVNALKTGLIELGKFLEQLQIDISAKDIKAASETIDSIRHQNYYINSVVVGDAVVFDFAQIKQLVDDHEIKYLFSKSRLGDELIAAWFKMFEAVPEHEFFSSDEMVQIYVDRSLPTVWNFSRDIVIICSEHAPKIVKDLIRRGQSRFALCGDACKAEFLEDNSDIQIVKVSETIDFLDFLIDIGFNNYAQSVCLVDPVGSSRNFGLEVVQVGQEYLNDLLANINTLRKFRTDWIYQKLINFAGNKQCLDQSGLPYIFKDRDVLVVSPGPSLKDDLSVLKQCQEDFLIIATAQSIPALMSGNIIPDFVMVVDSSDYSHVISETIAENALAIIAVEQVHRNFLAHNFKNRIILFDSHDVTPARRWRNIEPYDHNGGSVSVSAFKLAIRSGARSVALLGQDLVLSSGQYFLGNADLSKTEKTENQIFVPSNSIPKIEDDGKFYSLDGKRSAAFYLTGIDGKQHLTKGDYYFFHRQFVYSVIDLARSDATITVANCTSSGAYIEGFDHLPLAEHHRNTLENKARSPRNKQDELEFLLKRSVKFDDNEITRWFEDLRDHIENLEKSGNDLKNLLQNLDINDDRWSSYFSILQAVNAKFKIVDEVSSSTTLALNKRISVINNPEGMVEELSWFLEEMNEHCQYLLGQIERIAVDMEW